MSLRITKLVILETGTYNPMYSRPYYTHVTGELMEEMSNRVEKNGSAKVTANVLSGLVGQAITRVPIAGSNIYIPNGFEEKRTRFFMQATHVSNTGNACVYYFQGYSTHLGVSLQGSIDPEMEFYINSFIRVIRVPVQTPAGTVYHEMVAESAQIINGEINYTQAPEYKMRPTDIFTGINNVNLELGYSYDTTPHNGLIDTRITTKGESIQSKRFNNIPSRYIASIINDHHISSQLQEYGQNEMDIYTNSMQLSAEHPASEVPLLRALSNFRGLQNVTSFNLNILSKIDPNIANVTTYVKVAPSALSTMHHAGQSEHWKGRSMETVMASILGNALPALMIDLMLAHVAFKATNFDGNGQPAVIIAQGSGLTDINLAGTFEAFKQRFEREIMYDLTQANRLHYVLDVQSDVFGDTSIGISLDGQPTIMYTVPSYCDSLFVPIITPSKEHFFATVSDMDRLLTDVTGVAKFHNYTTTLI